MSAQQIDVHKVRLTTPIITAIKTLNASVDVSGFPKETGAQGFGLSRLEQNRAKTGPLPPVTLRKKDGNYEIIDGRHRVAIAIARGMSKIDAIVQEGGRRTRGRKTRTSGRRRGSKATRRR